MASHPNEVIAPFALPCSLLRGGGVQGRALVSYRIILVSYHILATVHGTKKKGGEREMEMIIVRRRIPERNDKNVEGA